jgi:hypothetical protein
MVQRWFHDNAMAQSVERLLHEIAPDPEALKMRAYERNSTKTQ